MHNDTILFDDGVHKCIMFSFDDETHEEKFLSLNQYLIIQGKSAVLLDPGSEALFEELYERVSSYIDIEDLKYIFFSHQDPDVAGSIAQWSSASSAQLVTPSIWVRFMSHYGILDMSRITPLEDRGAKIKFGEDYLQFIPAHFLHSPGNFSLYDSRSKILFSGDIGAAVMPPLEAYKEVSDFSKHVPYLESFHKRYMASNRAIHLWLRHLKNLDVKVLAPQHGAVFKDENAKHFFEWLKSLQCGIDLL